MVQQGLHHVTMMIDDCQTPSIFDIMHDHMLHAGTLPASGLPEHFHMVLAVVIGHGHRAYEPVMVAIKKDHPIGKVFILPMLYAPGQKIVIMH
jgi:hypothetical protein